MQATKWTSLSDWRASATPPPAASKAVPTCPYCEASSALVTGAAIYPHMPALHSRHFYHCAPCDAWVGCHPGTTLALGTLANKPLRLARKHAHEVFDPIWRVRVSKEGVPRSTARKEAYAWLSEELRIPNNECHIAMMGVDDCHRVIDLCQRLHRQRQQQRAREAAAPPQRRAWVHPDLRKPEAQAR